MSVVLILLVLVVLMMAFGFGLLGFALSVAWSLIWYAVVGLVIGSLGRAGRVRQPQPERAEHHPDRHRRTALLGGIIANDVLDRRLVRPVPDRGDRGRRAGAGAGRTQVDGRRGVAISEPELSVHTDLHWRDAVGATARAAPARGGRPDGGRCDAPPSSSAGSTSRPCSAPVGAAVVAVVAGLAAERGREERRFASWGGMPSARTTCWCAAGSCIRGWLGGALRPHAIRRGHGRAARAVVPAGHRQACTPRPPPATSAHPRGWSARRPLACATGWPSFEEAQAAGI